MLFSKDGTICASSATPLPGEVLPFCSACSEVLQPSLVLTTGGSDIKANNLVMNVASQARATLSASDYALLASRKTQIDQIDFQTFIDLDKSATG